jgi:anti-anti-sigma factor
MTVLRVTGELCGDTAAALHRIATTELLRSSCPLAFDLSGVTRIDRAGVDPLVSAAGLAGELNISLRLVGAQAGPVARALAAADMTELFEIFASVDESDEAPDIDQRVGPGRVEALRLPGALHQR